jgi:hypothetical protein
MNIFKKIQLFYTYKKIVKKHNTELITKFSLERDRIQRLWTVYKFPKEKEEDIKKYGHTYVDGEISKYVKMVSDYCQVIGLSELIKIEKIEVLNPLEVGVVFRYKFLKPQIIFWIKLLLIFILTIPIIIFII